MWCYIHAPNVMYTTVTAAGIESRDCATVIALSVIHSQTGHQSADNVLSESSLYGYSKAWCRCHCILRGCEQSNIIGGFSLVKRMY